MIKYVYEKSNWFTNNVDTAYVLYYYFALLMHKITGLNVTVASLCAHPQNQYNRPLVHCISEVNLQLFVGL